MAMMKNHEKHAALTAAFESVDGNMKRDKVGNSPAYGFAASSGMPRSPAQMASVKKAATTSAQNRHAKADPRNATAPSLGQVAKTSTGGLGLNKPKGLNVKKGLLGL